MAAPFLIIDGYNLMHALGMTRARYGPGDLERARLRFVNFLKSRLEERQRVRTTVVFDAHDAPPDGDRRVLIDGLEILYAEPGGDADTLIERLLAEHSAPKRVRLISSDHRLQKAARRRRARAVDSERFADELERAAEAEARGPEAEPPAAKYGAELPESELREWMEIFGEIPEASELSDDAERLDEGGFEASD